VSAELSIVIPAFNEEARISPTLESIGSYLDERQIWAEVLVVDDGSSDHTVDVVRSQQHRFTDLRVVPVGRNAGKGHAVRLGMLVAAGETRVFMDADNSTDIRELDQLTRAAERDRRRPEVVIASIGTSGASVEQSQSGLRSAMGRAGNLVIRSLVLPGIRDSQRGFKVFSARAAEAIFPRCRIDGWAFDVEVLVIARALGFDVLEVPVRWTHRDDSRVRATAYGAVLRDVWSIRRHTRRDLASTDAPLP
jgi:glycosyltransferase involved in cell wall biosynthesis